MNVCFTVFTFDFFLRGKSLSRTTDNFSSTTFLFSERFIHPFIHCGEDGGRGGGVHHQGGVPFQAAEQL